MEQPIAGLVDGCGHQHTTPRLLSHRCEAVKSQRSLSVYEIFLRRLLVLSFPHTDLLHAQKKSP